MHAAKLRFPSRTGREAELPDQCSPTEFGNEGVEKCLGFFCSLFVCGEFPRFSVAFARRLSYHISHERAAAASGPSDPPGGGPVLGAPFDNATSWLTPALGQANPRAFFVCMGTRAMATERVLIFDTTLRDGEQSPGASMNLAEKLEVAHALKELGVDIIEAGFPIASPGDFESVQTIAQQVEGPIIAGLARCNPADIDRAGAAVKDAARPRIHVFLATSAIHREFKLRMA